MSSGCAADATCVVGVGARTPGPDGGGVGSGDDASAANARADGAATDPVDVPEGGDATTGEDAPSSGGEDASGVGANDRGSVDGVAPGDASGVLGIIDASMSDASDGSQPDASDGSALDASDGSRSDASDGSGVVAGDATLGSACRGALASPQTPATALPTTPPLTVGAGFVIETVAALSVPRELAALPNGDLLVGTNGTDVYLVPAAEAAGMPGAAHLFAQVNDGPVQGVAFAAETCTIYVASQHGIYALPYVDGQSTATLGAPIGMVRTGSVSPNRPDTDLHITTSVAVGGSTLYVGVGSSCNACVEVDPTRAAIQAVAANGAGRTVRATRFRNPIALTIHPVTGTLWAGGAGQDSLPLGHPYEFFDAVTVHPVVADYGWPACEENQVAYASDGGCAGTVVPRIELPAYSTLIGAVFYPLAPGGAHAFAATYRGGLFLTAHGSWHTTAGAFAAVPRVAYVAMNGDTPVTPVDWSDPTKQWSEFLGGFQLADGTTRVGRPTGIAVGVQGSLFVADDQANVVYRIRPR